MNEYDGTIHDHTRKGGVVHTKILLSGHTPAGFTDRAVLRNAVEKIEKAKNAQPTGKIGLALPVELTQEQNISLVREYVNRHFAAAEMCADICIHNKNGGNPHAHIWLKEEAAHSCGLHSRHSKAQGTGRKIWLFTILV